ncbi:MAG: protein kinase, partial [Nannocystaceae bacterium]|nr:protein kinase [Nannocystaceae bacterium]
MHDSEPSTGRPAPTATAALAQGRPDERRDVGADLAMARVRGALFRRAVTAPKLGRYNVLHQLGAGAHGVVYAAYDDRLDRKVAIKVVHSDCAPDEVVDVQARLMREARALAKLTHPNVVAIYDVMPVETDADGPVTRAEVMLAMEYVGGKTLREWADCDSHPWREVLAVYRQAAQGLAAAHAHDLVHRDFKPAN